MTSGAIGTVHSNFFFFFLEFVYVANLEFIKVNEGFWRNVG